ncbi:MAG: alpha/beta hydrolase [Myxococcota bacterium]|nr:alpha/beta hydrolase [Myxococcota bacterium]
MKTWSRRLGTLGKVVRFDYPYQLEGRGRPDRPEVLIAAHTEALHKARKRHRGPVVLAGKSMGSRIGCHVSLTEPVDALVCLGYPLRSPAGRLRDAVLLELTTPVFFAQGSRDPLCPLQALDAVRPRMKARSQRYVVEGGNHSLEVGVRALASRGQTQHDLDAQILFALETFLRQSLQPKQERRR